MATTPLSAPEIIGARDHIVFAASASLGALNDTFGDAINLDPIQSMTVQIAGTFVGTVVAEISNDKVNWVGKTLYGPTGTGITSFSTPSLVSGDLTARYFRVRVSAYTSGTINAYLYGSSESLNANPSAMAVTNTLFGTGATSGWKLEDAPAASGDAGMATFGVRVPTTPAAQTSLAGDYGSIAIDQEGKQVMSGWGAAEVSFISNTNLTAVTDVALRAAQAAGIRTFVTDLILENTGGAAARVLVRDGTTTVLTVTLAAGQTQSISLRTPLRGTAATALNAQLGAAGTVTVTALGFSGV